MKVGDVRGVISLSVVIATLGGCGSPNPMFPSDTRNQVSIAQGVWGNVWPWEGDFMPGGGRGKITPIKRQVLVLRPVRLDSILTIHEVLSRAVRTEAVGQTLSNASGFFQVALPPGKYTLCVKEDTLFYANRLDGEGYILPATVFPDSVTKVQIDITLRAVF